MQRNPLELISALGLSGGRGGPSDAAVREFADRRRSFDWVHLGTSDLPIGRLLVLLSAGGPLKPPRTGHLGNWEEIARGRAGAMDFNQAICIRNFGYPLIYCFNQTEDDSLARGDWAYLPGSLVTDGRREVLPLLTWDGKNFAYRDRRNPLFVPLVWTEVGSNRLPLIQLHWQRMQAIGRFPFRLEAAVIHERREDVAKMLATLVEEAGRRENPRRAFQDLISHSVTLGGEVTRTTVRREGSGYWLEDVYFASTEALVEATLSLFAAVAEPDRFFAEIGGAPARLPVMAGLLVGVFSALFSTHFPGAPIDRASMTQPFNPHFHWGARAMAGFPPRCNGYFAERSTTRSIRQICDTLLAHFPQIDPIYFILMPSTLFMLCPPSSSGARDCDRLSALFSSVRSVTARLSANDDRIVGAVDEAVRTWLADYRSELSPYLLNRFTPHQGVFHDLQPPGDSEPVEPDGFRDLTMRQGCLIVGAMVEALQSATPLQQAAHVN